MGSIPSAGTVSAASTRGTKILRAFLGYDFYQRDLSCWIYTQRKLTEEVGRVLASTGKIRAGTTVATTRFSVREPHPPPRGNFPHELIIPRKIAQGLRGCIVGASKPRTDKHGKRGALFCSPSAEMALR